MPTAWLQWWPISTACEPWRDAASAAAAEPPFDEAWFRSGVRLRAEALWRGVEAQHVIATMKLVDNADEQQLLEELLETSKPAPPRDRASACTT